MYTTLLLDAMFFNALVELDHDLATTAQAGGCRMCGGRLDHADYPRKPRGGPATLAAAYDTRTSFCCDACRKRLTPMSVRFLGRKVYLGVVVRLACVLRHGPAPWRLARLREQVGVSADTLRRWQRWWREAFVRTPLWTAVRARFAPAIAEAALPQSVLERFTGEGAARVEAALRWLGPVTTTSAATLPDARGGPAEDAS